AVVALGGRKWPATAQVILAAHERERAAERAGVGEGAKIFRAVILFQAREREAGDGIVQVHLEHQVAFVVAEADVVARVKFLDQLALEQQCLGLAADRVIIEIANAIDERAEFWIPTESARG